MNNSSVKSSVLDISEVNIDKFDIEDSFIFFESSVLNASFGKVVISLRNILLKLAEFSILEDFVFSIIVGSALKFAINVELSFKSITCSVVEDFVVIIGKV